MRIGCLLLGAALVTVDAGLRAEPSPARAELNPAAAIAVCKVQEVKGRSKTSAAGMAPGLRATARREDDPLSNYQRTELGTWRLPAVADRSNPWIRVLLLAPKRPFLVDLAIFIDGQTFRQRRETWLDELLDSAKHTPQAAEAASPPGSASVGRERLLNFLAVHGSEVDRTELEYLMAEWGGGPPVLTLAPALSWQRSGAASVEAYLDANSDGVLSSAEILQASDRLQRADGDGDQLVDLRELRRAGKQRPAAQKPISRPLVVLIDSHTDWESLAESVRAAYPSQPGADDAASLGRLGEAAADLSIRVDFSSEDNRPGKLLLAAAPEFVVAPGEVIRSSEYEVVISDGRDDLHLVAGCAAGAISPVAAAQVALGAVVDGEPLMRLLDGDHDQQLSLRERDGLAPLLSSLDRNHDGELNADEWPTSLRLAVTLGPLVHEVLIEPVPAEQAKAPRPDEPPPEWFGGMDKNHDHDLSRTEFIGTADQFKDLDADGDGLISVAEALGFVPKQSAAGR